ncbi:uncharacterized protein LOC133892223 [Phragmites australis]|uniref:uncharacterized protein LOC133892223 n=1 Tax=Phragmites australis TaxID=29695 RepID=UPI002D79ADB2|nr:uncharacterized protein LOC133892223 [Phragmites australis]
MESYDVTFDESTSCASLVLEFADDQEMSKSLFVDGDLSALGDDENDPLLPTITPTLELAPTSSTLVESPIASTFTSVAFESAPAAFEGEIVSQFTNFPFWNFKLQKLFARKKIGRTKIDSKKNDDLTGDVEEKELYVERIRLETMELSLQNLIGKVAIQEPTFEEVIVLYRRKSPKGQNDRAIHVKHFKNIPMADMELVLPEKKNPSLTPMDWVQFIVSVVIGLVTLISSLEIPKADFWVVIAILSALAGYCAKIYFSFQQNMATYQNLITQSMYDKQLDSGKGTLLHLCDDVIQQEVKEVIIAYYILMENGKATNDDLDLQCEELIQEEFGLQCNFEVMDDVRKLERLGIITIIIGQD